MEQLPRDLRSRLRVGTQGDAYGLVVLAVFEAPDKRKFTCTLDPGGRIPPEFIAHLCLVV